ncbi:MAG: hypothetical protein L0G55_10900, partial [Corynebacterium sp.]|nr:hypothetical protein [Corynebacterium sp.]
MSISTRRFTRLSRTGIAAVALAPALVLATPAAVADETETPAADSSAPALSDDSGEGEGSSEGSSSSEGSAEGSLPGDISSSDAASSLADADWKAVASILGDVLGGDVSLQTILDIISVVNDGDATVGDVIG